MSIFSSPMKLEVRNLKKKKKRGERKENLMLITCIHLRPCVCHFSSFLCRSVVVPVKKPPPGSLAVTTVGATAAGSGLPTGSTSNIFTATGATPKSMINTTGIVLIYFCDTSSFSFCFLSSFFC